MAETFLLYYRVDKDMPWEGFHLEQPDDFNQALMHFDNLSAVLANRIGVGTSPVLQKEYTNES